MQAGNTLSISGTATSIRIVDPVMCIHLVLKPAARHSRTYVAAPLRIQRSKGGYRQPRRDGISFDPAPHYRVRFQSR